ncbi:hypothetical protein N9N67_12490, partial [Bacteriovoracaceae bacterium]|nr:hypothetical protein [Bacteriovoracaceae bacterium]
MNLNIYGFIILFISMSLQLNAKDIFYEISWEQIKNATKYEIEILDDKQELLQKEITATETFIWKYHKKGKFYFRFKYFIEDKESEFSDPRLILLKGKYKYPKRFRIYSPFDRHQYAIPEESKTIKIFFHFKKIPNIRFYRLLIADTPSKLSRNKAMYSLDLYSPKVNLSLPEGDYHWKVIAVHHEGILKSEVRKLKIVKKERKIATKIESEVENKSIEKRELEFNNTLKVVTGTDSLQYAFEKEDYDYQSNDENSILGMGVEGQTQWGEILMRVRFNNLQKNSETIYTESNFNINLIP